MDRTGFTPPASWVPKPCLHALEQVASSARTRSDSLGRRLGVSYLDGGLRGRDGFRSKIVFPPSLARPSVTTTYTTAADSNLMAALQAIEPHRSRQTIAIVLWTHQINFNLCTPGAQPRACRALPLSGLGRFASHQPYSHSYSMPRASHASRYSWSAERALPIKSSLRAGIAPRASAEESCFIPA